MTLGVMALQIEAEEQVGTDTPRPRFEHQAQESEDPLSVSETPPSFHDASADASRIPVHGSSTPPTPSPAPRKTVSNALTLLRSLQPAISKILRGEKGVKVPLTALDVMKAIRMRPSAPAVVLANVTDEGNDNEPTAEGESLGAWFIDTACVDRSAELGESRTPEKQEKVGAEVMFVGLHDVPGGEVDETRQRLRDISGEPLFCTYSVLF